MRQKMMYGICLILFLTIGAISLVGADEFKEADLKQWNAAFMDVAIEGERLFHSALGTNKVSCDMCHPNASNTHPETYPKFQKQLGKVVALRDMINWCIENPLEGKPLALDDPKMIALEAYITWERKGTPLDAGKH